MNTEKIEKIIQAQMIHISERKNLTVTGVEDVQSFDEESIILKTNLGMLAVDGKALHITHLSVETGELYIEGEIGGVVFFEPSEPKKKRGFFK